MARDTIVFYAIPVRGILLERCHVSRYIQWKTRLRFRAVTAYFHAVHETVSTYVKLRGLCVDVVAVASVMLL